MLSREINNKVQHFTQFKYKVSNSVYYTTHLLSFLGFIISISYTGIYGWQQGITFYEKICNCSAYIIADAMLAFFCAYLGAFNAHRSCKLRIWQMRLIGFVLFCLSIVAMVSDLASQHDLSNQQIASSYVKTLNDQYTGSLDTENRLKKAIEKLDPLSQPGNYRQISRHLSDITLQKREILHRLPKPEVSSVNSLNSWLAQRFELAEKSVNIIIKAIWAIFFIAGFTVIASTGASQYCDASLFHFISKQQRLALKAIRKQANFNRKLAQATGELDGSKNEQGGSQKKQPGSQKKQTRSIAKLSLKPKGSGNFGGRQISTWVANYKYKNIVKSLSQSKGNPSQRKLQDVYALTKEQAKLMIGWMLVDGVIRQQANRQYRWIN